LFIQTTTPTTAAEIMEKAETMKMSASREDKPLTTSEETGLDRDAFLKLLITQLRYQDPLNPMEDREFIAQMAQFSSLEQMQQMNRSLNNFLESNFLYQASALIGKEVEIRAGEGEEIKGVVQEVIFTEDGPYVVFADGEEYPMQDIVGIKEIGSDSDDR